jgi:energy-coupling factor transport system permease protein
MTAVSVLDLGKGVDPGAPIARTNPVAKLAVSLLISAVLLLSVDPVSGGITLAAELLALPWCGLGVRALWRRSWPVAAGAVSAGLATAVYGVDSGVELLRLGPLEVSRGSVASASAIALRVLAIGLPGVVLLATTDPTDLADALIQKLHLPARFVLAALAAMRLFGVLAEEWAALTLARRARGIGGGSGRARLRDLAGRLFALLVLAIRRGATLATTMESRGFGTGRGRTWARRSSYAPGDAVLVLGAVVTMTAAVAAAVLTGAWNFILV